MRSALWPAGTGRATRGALVAMSAALGGFAVIALVLASWVAAVASLIQGPTGARWLAVFYAVVAVGMPVPLLWAVQSLSLLHRTRLRTLLGVDIPAAGRRPGRGPWPIGPWRTAATWRQLAFHASAPFVGGLGGAVVAAGWLAPVAAVAWIAAGHPAPGWAAAAVLAAAALLLAAPPAARWTVRADTASARALLGPSRSDALAARLDAVARSRTEVVAAADAERRRIERDLHDGAQQRLVALAMNLGIARAGLADTGTPEGRAIVTAHDEAVLALAELRDLVRGLHPAVLDDRGLDAALSGIAARASFPVRLRVDVTGRCGPSVEAVAYFIVAEALTNIAKYAGATRAEVTVVRTDDRLHVVISDDGRGGATAGDGPGTGLRGLMQRAAAVDGTLAVDSPPGGPTVITAELPCGS